MDYCRNNPIPLIINAQAVNEKGKAKNAPHGRAAMSKFTLL